jgi:hypothetical protein
MLLETMSLSGMMSKNTIVLLDPINLKIEAGDTVSGFIPLLQDIFGVGMAVTIMVGINIRNDSYDDYGAGAIRDVVSDQITGSRVLNRRTRTIMSKRSQK